MNCRVSSALLRAQTRCISKFRHHSTTASCANVLQTDNSRVLKTSVTHDGKSIDVNFVDGTQYRFHTAWIKDSSPKNVGQDGYRVDVQSVFSLPQCRALGAASISDGGAVEITFKDSETERFNAKWLHAAAPYVGKLLSSESPDHVPMGFKKIRDTDMTQGPERKPWRAEGFAIPEFHFDDITRTLDAHIDFLECVLFQPGVAYIHGVPPPEDCETDPGLGAPLEKAVRHLIGRMNQHTNRETRFSVTHAKADMAGDVMPELTQKSMDYNCGFKLPMHTDHSQFPGTPGYLQFMQNLQGPVTSYVCDGLAIATFMKENFPDAFELLARVPVTHSFRNQLYTLGGQYRDLSVPHDPTDPTDPYEVCHTHPVIMLGPDGEIERIAQSETKRGICAIPYDIYDDYMAAYAQWTALVDDPAYVHDFSWEEDGVVVCNNYRVLHGRADLAPGDERTLIVGYTAKGTTDNKYRMLCQDKACRDLGVEGDEAWMSRLPNQVLSRMLFH